MSLTVYPWEKGCRKRLQKRSLCILKEYDAPNIESQCKAFFEEVEAASGKATSSESLVLFQSDFNVGIDNATWKGVIGQHGDPDINKNGRCLLQLCTTNGLCIMNSFFQHKRIYKYTWYGDSLRQRSLIDFCIVSADWSSTVSNCRVKRAVELSTDHHLIVCTLETLKPLRKRKTFRTRTTHRIKWESLADKEVRTAFADNIASKFKELPASTEDIASEWYLLRTAVITSATNCCGCKRVGGTKSSEKRTPWWNQEVKKAIRTKKVACKARFANKSSVELRSQYSEARKAAVTKVKLSKERAWKEFGKRLDDNFKTAKKYFGRPFAVCVERISSGFLHRRFKRRHFEDQDAILSRWRE